MVHTKSLLLGPAYFESNSYSRSFLLKAKLKSFISFFSFSTKVYLSNYEGLKEVGKGLPQLDPLSSLVKEEFINP